MLSRYRALQGISEPHGFSRLKPLPAVFRQSPSPKKTRCPGWLVEGSRQHRPPTGAFGAPLRCRAGRHRFSTTNSSALCGPTGRRRSGCRLRPGLPAAAGDWRGGSCTRVGARGMPRGREGRASVGRREGEVAARKRGRGAVRVPSWGWPGQGTAGGRVGAWPKGEG